MGADHLFPKEFRFGGGLNLVDAPDAIGFTQETRIAENFRLTGQGWVGTRKAALELADISGWTAVAIFPYNLSSGVGGVLLEWDGSARVRLATVDGSGGSHTVIATLPGYESGVSTFPEIVGAVLGRVLFMCDTARQYGLVVYDPNNVLNGREYQSAFNSGSEEPSFGDTIVGAASGATGIVMGIELQAGSWGGGDASGYIRIAEAGKTGTFQAGENIDIQGGTANALTLNGAFGLLQFGLFQPRFDFDSDLAYAIAKPRVVVEHENHLWMFGYGDESEPDRGELARFSYLGIIDDAQGSGDAGAGSPRPGSTSLFDIDDVAPVAPKGSTVVCAASAPGRLSIGTEGPHRFSVIYGTGRDTWRRDQLDNERGGVATRAMVEADGIVYNWSPLGPCFYAGGGQLLDISRKVDPRTEDIDLASLFGVHFPQDNQVRWYHRRRSDTIAGADRWIGYNYLERGWEEDVLGYRVFCAGWLLPAGTEGPAAGPSGLTHEAITAASARALWTPGDTAPGVVTRVYRAPDVGGSPGTYTRVAELGPGAKEFTHVGLDASTKYWTKVEHFRNGQVSAAASTFFTTLAITVVPPPLNVLARAIQLPAEDGGDWMFSVLVSWDPGGVTAGTLRYTAERRIDGGAWSEIVSAEDVLFGWDNGVTLGSLYEYRVKAIDAQDNESAYSSIASVTPQGLPYIGWPDDHWPGAR